jgi:hypothetical protein
VAQVLSESEVFAPPKTFSEEEVFGKPPADPYEEFAAVPKPPTLMRSLAERIAQLPRAQVPSWVPFIGGFAPSATGMAQGLYQQAQSAATLPGDVYAGRVDPLSEEGIRRSFEAASILPQSPLTQLSMYRPPAGLSQKEILDRARASYQTATRDARAIPMAEGDAATLAADARANIAASAGPRPARASEAHGYIDDLEKAKDWGDVLEQRANLREVAGGSGPNKAAAASALDTIDRWVGNVNPQLVPTLRTADKNFSAAMTAKAVEELNEQAMRASGLTTSKAANIRQAYRALAKKPETIEGLMPGEISAIGQVGKGVKAGLLATGAAFDPTTSRLGPILSMLSGFHDPKLLAAMPAGMIARQLYDRMMAARVQAIPELILQRSPASMAVTPAPSVLRMPNLPINPIGPTLNLQQTPEGYPYYGR